MTQKTKIKNLLVIVYFLLFFACLAFTIYYLVIFSVDLSLSWNLLIDSALILFCIITLINLVAIVKDRIFEIHQGLIVFQSIVLGIFEGVLLKGLIKDWIWTISRGMFTINYLFDLRIPITLLAVFFLTIVIISISKEELEVSRDRS